MARKERKYHYIYKITCLKNNRYYIGMHSTDNLEDVYMGGGKRIKNSVKKHGKDAHKKEILEFFENRDLLRQREVELVNEELLNDPLCMNLALGGESFSPLLINGEKHLEISILGGIAMKNKILEDNIYAIKHGKNSSKVMKKNHEERKIRYDTFTGKNHSKETKEKIGTKNSISQKGNKNSQFGTIWIHHKERGDKKINPDDFSKFFKEGWEKGRNKIK